MYPAVRPMQPSWCAHPNRNIFSRRASYEFITSSWKPGYRLAFGAVMTWHGDLHPVSFVHA